MDAKVIEQKQLVERYLFGRLSPPEAKFFEQLVKKSPELAERMGLPLALKRAMHLLDETSNDWRERAPPFWQRPVFIAALGAAIAMLAIIAVVFWSGKSTLAQRYTQLQTQTAGGLLPAPTRNGTFRMQAVRAGEKVPSYAIGGRFEPTMAELFIDVGYVKNNLFKVTITRDDGTFWGRMENQVKDSNGDLRLAFNSAAFAAGTYHVAFYSVNLRGEGDRVGTLDLEVAAK